VRVAFAGLLLLTSACSRGLSGTVVDADTDLPVANATVDIFTSGWGFNDGRLVWDKTTRHRAHTSPDGRFRLPVGGGVNLTVAARGYPTAIVSMCSLPGPVRIGGPYPDYLNPRQIRAGARGSGEAFGWSFDDWGRLVPEHEAELRLVGKPPTWSERSALLEAPLGMRFVPGGGNPPPPPRDGYAPRMRLDFAACGWLFVRTRGGRIVAVDPNGSTAEDPDGGRYLLLTYRLPAP
jgi:hypothetical protein